MSYWTYFSTGLLPAPAASEAGVIIRPKFPPATPKSGVMFVHGAGSGASYCISDVAYQARLTRKIAAEGYIGWSGDNGNAGTPGGTDNWGNDTAIARLTAGRTYLQGTLGAASGKVALVSGSMGGANSFAWAAANPTLVSCIVSVIPVIDINDIHANNRWNFAASINAAYGGTWSQATYGATHNPLTMAQAGKFAGIPMLLFYGLTDDLCLPAKTEEFASAVGSSVQLVGINGGHAISTYEAVNHDTVVDFIKTYA